ncbi:CoA-dependent acyltransferase [Microstroma glucosiphilum]|uniref:Dihydrolipoamide acetyltransferase component of pyruvate dehydrogenase complex n=1 Tax=Pseudomicrostroma glucosiphilum TaxID=1684307 RepID=A0A316UEG5_9BASI|nr:CoA-dependent acyltransferase [Pseudomicrostroma glucosiphilum]PWN23308.1 CoA-dependent acyltransferase [Pseudomicrostroma glucosiphilum]
MAVLRFSLPSSSSSSVVASGQAGRSRLTAAALPSAALVPHRAAHQSRAASSSRTSTSWSSSEARYRTSLLTRPGQSYKPQGLLIRPTPRSRSFSSTPHPSRTLQSLPLADIGEGISEVEVLQWHVRPGSSIEEFQRLCEVQSDKASVEITSRYTGVVERLGAKEGEVMKVGGELCAIWVEEGEGEGEQAGMVQVEEKEQPLQQVAAHTSSPPEQTSAPTRRPHPLDDNVDKAAALSTSSSSASSSREAQPRPTSRQEHLQTLATPAVRWLCKEHNLDLAQIAGTGKEGRVTREDVLVHLGRIQRGDNGASSSRGSSLASDNVQTRASLASASTASTSATADRAAPASQPLTGIRKAMFKSLSLSTHIPHFTFSEELDVTDLEALRLKINRGLLLRQAAASKTQGQEKLTLLPFLLKALSHAMSSHPLFRSKLSLPSSSSSSSSDTPTERYSSLASSARLIGPRKSHDIGFALSTPSGLLTPVIRGVEEHSVQDLARELSRLQNLARSPSGLSRVDLEGMSGPSAGIEGGTLILSNIGSLGCGTGASPVLPPTGELAIGAVCAVKRGFRWSDDPSLAFSTTSTPLATATTLTTQEPYMVPRLLAPVTFAGDHRVLQGTELAAFVKEWKWWVEHPEMWVAMGR